MKLGPFELKLSRRRARVREFGIQSVGDLLLQLESAINSSSTNRYISRAQQAAETIRKYRGQATKGNLLTKNIINTRAAFTVGRGLGYIGPEAESAFVSEFFKANRINLAYLQQLARERCFEGQALLILSEAEDRIPRVRFLSWTDTSYEVNPDPFDYSNILSIDYRVGQSDVRLRQGQFAFFKFDTRMNSYEGTPLLAGLLNSIEDLDDSLTSWRTLNSKFSRPSAYFRFETEDDAAAFQTRLATLNNGSPWQWGDSLAGAGDGTVLQIGYGPYQSMLEEIHAKAKIISGHTGVPSHYFGFADLMDNRSVADDIRDMFVVVSEVEQSEWIGGFTDLVGRAIAIYNRRTGSRLDTSTGRIDLELVSESAWQRIAEIWLPLYLDGAITLETLLAKVPGIDEVKEAAAARAEVEARGGTPRQLGAQRVERAAAQDVGGVM
ncbi:MAG: hypothetical protein AB1631_31465 [Acidobacteriota bacterium]